MPSPLGDRPASEPSAFIVKIWSQARRPASDWKMSRFAVGRPVRLGVLAAEGELPEIGEVRLLSRIEKRDGCGSLRRRRGHNRRRGAGGGNHSGAEKPEWREKAS